MRADIERLSLRMAAEIERPAVWSEVDGAAGRRPKKRAACCVPALPRWRGARRRRHTDPAVSAVARSG